MDGGRFIGTYHPQIDERVVFGEDYARPQDMGVVYRVAYIKKTKPGDPQKIGLMPELGDGRGVQTRTYMIEPYIEDDD